MNARRSDRAYRVAFTLAALVSFAGLGGCDEVAAGDVNAANAAEKIEQARTPADHRALASYYDERARLEERDATAEREARTRYGARWSAEQHPMGRRAREHYDELIEDHAEAARRYHGMAGWHRDMAMQAEGVQPAGE